MNSIKVSVVIPVFNEERLLSGVLNKLNEQNSQNFEVIVVDNLSTDGTVKITKQFEKKVKYPLNLISQDKPGVAWARKKGMDLVLQKINKVSPVAHFMAVTDADTLPFPEWTSQIEKGFSTDKVGGLAGTHQAPFEVEECIYRAVKIKNYFNVLPAMIEFFERKNIGEIKMSGPNSAFDCRAYEQGGGIQQEYDEFGNPRMSEVNNLGIRIKKSGYSILPMNCRVVKNRRRELFEIIHGGKSSYFTSDNIEFGRFNVIREDEGELLQIACESVSWNHWVNYRNKLIFKVVKNFIFNPLIAGELTADLVKLIFSTDEVNYLLSCNCIYLQKNNKKLTSLLVGNLEDKVFGHE